MVNIGNRKPQREIIAEARMLAATAERGFVFAGIEPAPVGPGVIAVAVNGKHTIVHLGRDKADALFGLAALAARPEGRA